MIIISHQLMAIRASIWGQLNQHQENKLNPKDHVLREVVNSLRDIAVEFHGADQLRERLRGALAPLLAPQPVAVHDENARWAIEGAIAFGRMDVNKPPSDDHWLMEYWLIGRYLAPLGRLDASTAKLMAGQFAAPTQPAHALVAAAQALLVELNEGCLTGDTVALLEMASDDEEVLVSAALLRDLFVAMEGPTE